MLDVHHRSMCTSTLCVSKEHGCYAYKPLAGFTSDSALFYPVNPSQVVESASLLWSAYREAAQELDASNDPVAKILMDIGQILETWVYLPFPSATTIFDCLARDCVDSIAPWALFEE